MTRIALGAVFAAALGALAPAGSAAPVPKGAENRNTAPDIKLTLDAVARAVKAQKWPEAEEEQALRAFAQQVLNNVQKAAELKERALPADASKLAKLDVLDHYEVKVGAAAGGGAVPLAARTTEGKFIICGSAKGGIVRNSVVFASGDVQFTTGYDSVIVGKNVRVTGMTNCVLIASDYLRLSTSRVGKDGGGNVLVAGQWLRGVTLTGALCHVVKPTGAPMPDDPVNPAGAPAGRSPAIRGSTATGAVFLNEAAEVSLTAKAQADTKYVTPKAPIAK
jgi:hypothetical protein